MAQKVYIGVNSKKVTLKNLFPEVNANGFSGTNVTESTTHTKYTA